MIGGTALMLTSHSTGRAPHTEIPQRIRSNSPRLQFWADKVSLPTPCPDVPRSHRPWSSRPILCPLQELSVPDASVQLEQNPWRWLVENSPYPDQWYSHFRPLDPACSRPYSFHLLRPWQRRNEHVSTMATEARLRQALPESTPTHAEPRPPTVSSQ